MHEPRCTADYTTLVGGCGLKYGAACAKENSGGRVSYRRTSTPFLYIGPLVKTTSGIASKAFPSSKSDWTLSRRRANSASTAKSSIFAITFE